MGSPETVYVHHKAKALCYNTVSFLPVRLIRAPVLKPRPRSQAGQPAGCLVPIWQTSSSRAVRRGRIYAARGRLPCGNAFGFVYAVPLFVGEAYMPPGRGVLPCGVCGKIGRLPRPTMQNKQHSTHKRPMSAPFRGRHVLYSAITWYTA